MIEIQLPQWINVIFADCSVCFDAGQRSLTARVEVQQVDGLPCERIIRNGKRAKRFRRQYRHLSRHLLADSHRVNALDFMGKASAPCFRHLVVGNSDCLDSLRCVIETWKFYLDPLRLVFSMSKSQCVSDDLKRNTLLGIFLRAEIFI